MGIEAATLQHKKRPAFGPTALAAILAALGLALVGVAGASAAPGHFTANFYPAHLDGSTISGKANTFTVGTGVYQCTQSVFTGDIAGKTTELTLEPSYSSCANEGQPQTITTNGCDYVLHSGEGTESQFAVTADLVCPGEKGIEIHGYASAGKHTEGVSNCTHTISAKTGLTGLTHTKEAGTNSFILEGTLEGLPVQTHGSCTLGFTVEATAPHDVNVTVRATEPGHFTADSYPTTYDGTLVKEKANSLTVSGSSYDCTAQSLKGQISAKSTELTIEPTYSGCSKEGEQPQTVTLNGCDYLLHSGEGDQEQFATTVDVICPVGKQIEIHGYASSTKHGEGVSNCTLTIAEQKGLKGPRYTKEAGTDSFVLEGAIEGMTVQTHGACGFNLTINLTAAQHVNATFLGTNAGHFAAGSYPATLDGSALPGKENIFTSGFNYKCTTTAYTGTLSEKATELTLVPSYSGCAREAEPATVTWNGCDYLFRTGEGTASEFPVTVDLVCPVGKRVEIHGYTGEANHKAGASNCTLTIGSQTGLNGLTYTAEAGTNSFVLEGAIEGIKAETHAACSFNFTIQTTMVQDLNATVLAT